MRRLPALKIPNRRLLEGMMSMMFRVPPSQWLDYTYSLNLIMAVKRGETKLTREGLIRLKNLYKDMCEAFP